jgi:hypothetical protein
VPTPRGLLAGPKAANSHTTVTEDAAVVIAAAKSRPEVTKVRNSIISGRGSGKPRLKIAPVNGGLRVTVLGTNATQDVYVYTADPPLTSNALRAAWGRR